MSAPIDRRECQRNIPQEQLLSILQAKGLACDIETCAKDILYMFVDVKDCSDGGLMLQIPFQLATGTIFNLSVADRSARSWDTRTARIVWTCKHPDGHYNSGVEFLDKGVDPALAGQWETDPLKPSPADLLFLITASFFQAISEKGLCLLLNALRKTVVKRGERIITQGESGECLYLIQAGTCIVFVEKEGRSHVVVRLGAGDVLGEMAVLTGEPRTASVDAETDMVLWKLDLRDFESLTESHPELRLFLTEIMSNRFDSSLFVGDRTIGKYVLNSKIGTGGWGIVYRGLHKILKLPVAIKMMKHDMAMEKSFLDTFRQEAEIIARMSHPNIVSVYDIEEIYKTIFIIMEYLEGKSLKEHMKKIGPLPAKRCAGFFCRSATGWSALTVLILSTVTSNPPTSFCWRTIGSSCSTLGWPAPQGPKTWTFAGQCITPLRSRSTAGPWISVPTSTPWGSWPTKWSRARSHIPTRIWPRSWNCIAVETFRIRPNV